MDRNSSEPIEPGSPSPHVRVSVLGRFVVEVNGSPLRFGRRSPQKPLQLLKALVALGGDSVAAETLCDILWPDALGDQAQHSLHITVGRLRGLIGTAAVAQQHGRLSLTPTTCWVDAFACAEHLERVPRLLRDAHSDDACAELQAALELYQGPILDGEFDLSPVLLARTKLHDLLLRTVEQTALDLHAEGRIERSIEILRRALDRDDQAESLYQGLMRAYLAAGRPGEGLAAYRRCSHMLEQCFATVPSADTESLHRQLSRLRPEAGDIPELGAGGGNASSESEGAEWTGMGWPRKSVARVALALSLPVLIGVLLWTFQGWWLLDQGAPTPVVAEPGQARPYSIAVLAFENLTGDPKQEYLGDGIADTLITALARVPQLLVAARTSSFVYKRGSEDVRNIGRALAVRHVLEGSILRSGDRLRITAQLIDSGSGQHVWAAAYEHAEADIFKIMDDIARNVITEVGARLRYGQSIRIVSAGTDNVEAFYQSLQAGYQFMKFEREANYAARRAAMSALALDPDFAWVMVTLAWTHLNDARMGWAVDRGEAMRSAQRWADRCQAADPDLAMCLNLQATLLTERRRHEDALAMGERALALEPRNAHLYQGQAHRLLYAGVPAEALELAQRALELRPAPTVTMLAAAGESHFQLGRYEESRPYFERMLSITGGRGFHASNARLRLVAVHTAAGRELEAHALAGAHLEAIPTFTLARFQQVASRFPYRDPKWFATWLELLRQAGLPEKPPSAAKMRP